MFYNRGEHSLALDNAQDAINYTRSVTHRKISSHYPCDRQNNLAQRLVDQRIHEAMGLDWKLVRMSRDVRSEKKHTHIHREGAGHGSGGNESEQ